MTGSEVVSWPVQLTSLITELRTYPGRIALLRQTPETDSTVRLMSEVLGEEPLSVGRALTAGDAPPKPDGIPGLVGKAIILRDLDILFWDALEQDPLTLLRILSRNSPRVAVWPGQVSSERATYSEPGRHDYFSQQLGDAIVLTPRPVIYPDETPYTTERIQA